MIGPPCKLVKIIIGVLLNSENNYIYTQHQQ